MSCQREGELSPTVSERVASMRENLAKAEACAKDGSFSALCEGRGLVIDVLFEAVKLPLDKAPSFFHREVRDKCEAISVALRADKAEGSAS